MYKTLRLLARVRLKFSVSVRIGFRVEVALFVGFRARVSLGLNVSVRVRECGVYCVVALVTRYQFHRDRHKLRNLTLTLTITGNPSCDRAILLIKD